MSEIIWIFKVGVMQMIIPVLQFPEPNRNCICFPNYVLNVFEISTCVTEFMNDKYHNEENTAI